jgi:FkbM family methyltransferase
MPFDLLTLRLVKLWTSVSHPSCWGALASGVAPSVEHFNVLRAIRPDGLLDVGANRGQFTLACRLVQPGIPVVAFEPIPAEAVVFRRVHGHATEVALLESALGDAQGEATLHLSKSADSSSLLPIGKNQTTLFADTQEVGTLKVPVQRLDDLSESWAGRKRQLLKLDVQGFELSVLHGAVETLKSCAYVYVECSEIPLYDGQALRAEVESFLQHHGFTRESRHNEQWDGAELVQADYLFVREPRELAS